MVLIRLSPPHPENLIKLYALFSSSDELTAIDWYYKCTLMSTWKSDAGIANYDALMETPYEYIDLLLL